MIRVMIEDHTNNKKFEVEVPENVPMSRLIPVLVNKLNLPQMQNGNQINYRLEYVNAGRRLNDNETLEMANVMPDSMLRLLPEFTAAGLSPEIRQRRLRSDSRRIQLLAANSDTIHIMDAYGAIPELYTIQFTVGGISCLDDHNDPVISYDHQVQIGFGTDYPSQPPIMRWLTPIFHPNIAANGAAVCIDVWYPSKFLDDLVIMLGEMIQYQNYNPYSALNRPAGVWAIQHAQILPIDTSALMRVKNY